MLGLATAFFVMGLLITLIFRRLHSDSSGLSVTEMARGLAFIVPLGVVAGVAGGVGYFLGLGLQKLLTSLNYQIASIPLLGAVLGGLLGFFGLYTYMAAAKKGWRWLWVSWLMVAVLSIGVVLSLNLRGTGLDTYLDPVRGLPVLDRLSQVTITESGTGKVRVLIWDAAMELVAPHEPLGITEDEMLSLDRFNVVRPLIGYGPESMFNAFAYVYPPELAHVEARGSSADRSHNETMDSLVITGVLGFLAFYFLMISLFYYTVCWLGWAADTASRRRFVIWLTGGGIGGAFLAYLADGGLTFLPLGLPFGVVAGLVIHLIWQGIISQPDKSIDAVDPTEELLPAADPQVVTTTQSDDRNHFGLPEYYLLLIGLLGAVIGHFIEVHFVFSIAATYTYFWVYIGLMVALAIMRRSAGHQVIETESDLGVEEGKPAASATYQKRTRSPGRSPEENSSGCRLQPPFG